MSPQGCKHTTKEGKEDKWLFCLKKNRRAQGRDVRGVKWWLRSWRQKDQAKLCLWGQVKWSGWVSVRKRNTWQSLATVDNHIWTRGKEQERESSNSEMERDKREMVHRVYMAAVKEKNVTGRKPTATSSHTYFCISNADICVFWWSL